MHLRPRPIVVTTRAILRSRLQNQKPNAPRYTELCSSMTTTRQWSLLLRCWSTFFSMNREKATQVMLAVHTQGKGVCGIYTRDVAETKAELVNQAARDNGHPLLCEVEPSQDDEGE